MTAFSKQSETNLHRTDFRCPGGGLCRPPKHMILCIESHLGDTYLSGSARTKPALKRQLLHTEAIRDVEHDNFVPLLCRLYGWELTAETAADFTWDRDTELLLPFTHP